MDEQLRKELASKACNKMKKQIESRQNTEDNNCQGNHRNHFIIWKRTLDYQQIAGKNNLWMLHHTSSHGFKYVLER